MEARKCINELDPYVPGRSKEEIAQEFGVKKEDILKLGSNENPWGPSKKAAEAVKEYVLDINRYPETNLELLKKEFADYSGVDTNQIIVGGDGADEIIDVLAKTFINPGDEFIVPLPSYMYYEFLFKPYGAIPHYAVWNVEENSLDVDSVLEAINEKTKMIFLCSPNNPTGGLVKEEQFRAVLEKIKDQNTLLVIDEAYFEYSEVTNVELLKEYDNIFIIRTMSKVMGLAGARVGYGISSPKVIEYMHRVKPVFSVTKLSYIAALATIQDKEFIEESTKKGIESREFLYEEINKMNSVHIYPSKSNYLLIDIHNSGFTAAELTKEFMKKGVIVRDCTSFKGLDEYYIRISICTLEEDAKFIEIMKEILNE
ncbi:MAG: histidinol-phosphate transaminase [Methanobacteriaceae archaeon]|nr:histidinol-phosphate transaminase [Methanobacteriaceae archaeon]